MVEQHANTLSALTYLVGLGVVAVGRVGNMRIFDFGDRLVSTDMSPFTLHIQCSWRIVTDGEIWTGSADHYYSASGNCDDFVLNPTTDDTLQDIRLTQFLSFGPIVVDVSLDSYGGIVLLFSNGMRLMIFVGGTCGEAWRFFEPDSGKPHLVYPDQALYEA